ncbi:MAG: cytochrome c biogenesis protein CcsA [Actinobacteria bacterium]|nr:cytochrome c biogenesis protein CcsA [Actinomycetota bacterium]MCG2807819.1 cytochrome c biogenesis protein [Coriobacteriia bacterium]
MGVKTDSPKEVRPEVADKKVLGLSKDSWIYTFLGLGFVLTTLDFLMAFLVSPLVLGAKVSGVRVIGGAIVQNQLLFSQKIFYFHVPVALGSFLVFFFTAFYGVRFLMTKDKIYDTKAKIATEVTLLFVILTLITGDLWTRFEWGQWWVWEPRLTTYFIMTLLVIAYFVLRNSIEDEERRATYAAVFGIVAFLDAPISFAITRMIPSSVHPVVLRSGGGLLPTQLIPFLSGLFGMLMIAWVIYQVRLKEEVLRERVEAVKAALEDDLTADAPTFTSFAKPETPGQS